jgi:catechol 2,3-dioxygenase-like lactoylglutathione lyase family enzyme
MTVTLAVVSLWAPDVAKAIHFYRDLIGLDLLPHHGEHPHFDLGSVYLVLLQGRPRPPQDPDPSRFPVMAFAVEDLDRLVETLRGHGIQFLCPVEEGLGTRYVMLDDPAGNLIELVEYNR